MTNVSEKDYEQAITALLAYQKSLIEVSDAMQQAVNQTSRNLQGDENIQIINANLQKRIIKIHEASLAAKNIALSLSLELEEIKRTRKILEDQE